MDVFILLCTLLFWISLSLSLWYFYAYAKKKKQIDYNMEEILLVESDIKGKRDAFIIRVIKKSLTYADDFSAIGQRVNFFSESHEVSNWLKKAGNPLDLTVETFQGLKMFLTFCGFVAGMLFIVLGLPFAELSVVIFPVTGYFLPILIVKNKAKSRQEKLRYDLPDFLDTISVSLSAGVSLDQALRQIINFFSGPIHEEFKRFNQEIDLGVEREVAYRNLLERNDNQEFQTLIKSLIQGMKLGVPIATTFKHQANDMRIIRKELVKEKASKASPKITLITTFLVMPTAVFLIGGLMIMNMFFGENSMLNMFK